MKRFAITTLTLNPSLDKSTHFDGLVAEQKIHCEKPRYDAGGGGINVSKAVAALGGNSLCIHTSGGSAGEMLEKLLEQKGIERLIIATKNWTRENFIAFDNVTKAQYRFGFPGNELTNNERTVLINAIKNLKTDYLVISGSLNDGMPADFYQNLAEIAKASAIKVILDTSGEALSKALDTGVYLIKPNIRELAKLIGIARLESTEIEKAARSIINKGGAEIVVVSLGAQGGLLVTQNQTEFVPAPPVTKKSTVGAGDSMVGGMVWALSQNKSLKEVLQWGVCCGTAATMNEGTQLFIREDAEKLYDRMM